LSTDLPNTPLARTGLTTIDNAARAPRAVVGIKLIRDPTLAVDVNRIRLWDRGRNQPVPFHDLEQAYDVDSYVSQGIDKYVELISKHGWYLECASAEPVDYLIQRFQYMSIMTGKPFSILVDELVRDVLLYGNAFWVKKRQKAPDGVAGLPSAGAAPSALPVLGYFRVDPKRLRPQYDADGKQLLSWLVLPDFGYGSYGTGTGSYAASFAATTSPGSVLTFRRGDVLHFPMNPPAGRLWGRSPLITVLDDIRGYRQCEEYVIKLLYKHLNPLFHHMVPDVMGNGQGRQEDVDDAAATHPVVAPDGFIVTPPGHKIEVIGAESHALRGEGYMQLLRERIYAGLGVNPMVMGEADASSAGSADAMTVTMHNRAKFYQRQIGAMLTEHILYELLIEGGFDPTKPSDQVRWSWRDIEVEAQIARENHAAQLYLDNGISLSEFRKRLGEKPATDEELQDFYINRVQIPLVVAQGEARAGTLTPGSGPENQTSNRSRPANQHGRRNSPKIRPNS
jgi:hypothetical protein